MRALLAPLASGLTYRRFVHLLLGAVVLLPYLGLAWLLVTSVGQGGPAPGVTVALVLVAVGAGAGVLLVPGVRALEVAAARALLGADVPDADDAWPQRWRTVGWTGVVVVAGAVTALAVLVAVPLTLGLLLAPFVPVTGLPAGWRAAWAPLVALVLPLLLAHLVALLGEGLARLAPRLLGPAPAELLATQLARARAEAAELAERNRLARELHDSVGHALTVTTLQAEAAARVLATDPAFVATALEAIAEAGRDALADLDHVLGLLRDPVGGDRATTPGLADLDALLAGTRAAGVAVAADVRGAPDGVPAAVSREAYRIVQESLTNAARHAGGAPVGVRVRIGGDAVEMEVTNPVGPSTAGRSGGRGLTGMRERVGLLGGELTAGERDGTWRVLVRLPLAR